MKGNVTNTGSVAGTQVAQLYLYDVDCFVQRSLKELKEFKKVFLKSRQSKTIKLCIDKKALSFWGSNNKAWKAELGRSRIHIGSSSRDIKLTAEFDYK